MLLTRRHLVIVHIGISVGLFVLAQLTLVLAHQELSLAENVALEVAIAAGSLSIPPLITVVLLRDALAQVMHLATIGSSASSLPLMLKLVQTELSAMVTTLEDLQRAGAPFSTGATSEWVRSRIFEAASGRYTGADHHPPGEYMSLYADYLSAQEAFLSRIGNPPACRIILADPEALKRDREAFPEAYDRFMEWHRRNCVSLLWIDYARACELAEKCRLGRDIDVALWQGELALVWSYFRPGDDSAVMLRLGFEGDGLYSRVAEFITRLEREAVSFPNVSEWAGSQQPVE